MSGASFKKSLVSHLPQLSLEIGNGYVPSGLLAIPKPKAGGGFRVICVPTIADRLIQFAILDELRPRFERTGLDNSISYGLARGRAKSVVGARAFACKARAERRWVYKTDIHKFFDNLDRAKLRKSLLGSVRQRSLLPLVEAFLGAEITDGIEPQWRKVVSDAGIQPGVGVRQGMPLSPFFAGSYLKEFDQWLSKRGVPAARYVDDIVMFFDSEKGAREFHPRMSEQMAKLGLSIGAIDDPTSKTQLYAPDTPADFLGMEITPVGDSYKLWVASSTIAAIGLKFAALSEIAALTERRVHLTTLGSYLSSIECGYANAYDGAHNMGALKDELRALSEGARQKVLLDLFGDKLEGMTPAELRFVGVQ